MGFIQRAKCLAGFHDWMAWSAKSADCSQTRYCSVSDCHGKETKTVHDWTPWGTAINSCKQVRHCPNCHKSEVHPIIEHQWSDKDWSWVDENTSCQQERRCPKCDEPDERLVHVWGSWQPESPLSDRLIRYCRRCNDASETKGPDPIIGVPKTSKDPDAPAGVGILMLWTFIGTMKINTLPRRKDERAVLSEATIMVNRVNRVNDTGVYLQIGFKPSPVRPDYEYLTWEWDEKEEKYVVVIWRGGHWETI